MGNNGNVVRKSSSSSSFFPRLLPKPILESLLGEDNGRPISLLFLNLGANGESRRGERRRRSISFPLSALHSPVLRTPSSSSFRLHQIQHFTLSVSPVGENPMRRDPRELLYVDFFNVVFYAPFPLQIHQAQPHPHLP